MNKVFRRTFSLLNHPGHEKPESPLACRYSSNEPKDDDDKNQKQTSSHGIIRDKQQSAQEEKFFHKESKDQLKALKEKGTKKNKNQTDK